MTKHIYGGMYFQRTLDLDLRDEAIAKAITTIKDYHKKGLAFDAIAFRGVSGALMGSIISYELRLPPIVVRKKEEGPSHADGHFIEASIAKDIKSYLILDDTVATGRTIASIIAAIDTAWRHPAPKCVGAYMYNAGRMRPAEECYSYYIKFKNEKLV